MKHASHEHDAQPWLSALIPALDESQGAAQYLTRLRSVPLPSRGAVEAWAMFVPLSPLLEIIAEMA